ncbi:MAG: glutamate-1-semialdehyde-2,1-aminomutase [Candidatus Methanoliparum thermophilum]|uniref:Glutamate-1-semialdehyde 2,1-aminomutase n=1 Tax=Methanoliparum thermophilum TaxID=2491083 RepID=A0A520KS48_METT2|nr:glutamate-1-semialdehyde 2,1-aminomutase [Candidatus Methanoliparum sp. LAM-1]RZN64423.1 MAG: glutamate-1-semialdehyde-2,1-aminomutase [Candidatus Methanoliparum thermophilum]BDC35990.1 aspartate aminotransferase family protein [Candidatus Methanoliparum sp. LAM-1]
MKSVELYKIAKDLLPAGVSSPVRAIEPYPIYMKDSDGSKLIDVEGNEYIDYCLGFGPLILGHKNPKIMNAVIERLKQGWLYGTPIEEEIILAKLIIKHIKSIEMLRYVNTGTEATMSAIRVARGFTSKDKIVKIEGSFHGAHDIVLVKTGSGGATFGIPNSSGIPKDSVKNTIQVPFNDLDSLSYLLDKNKDEIAAVILEPVLGNIGVILPEKDYLKEVRRLTLENDVLLIFDEIITGFRLSLGGAQGYFGIKPDLTTLGKIVGGGFPIGVFGGRREIMENISPLGPVYQAGTFSGNPISLTAGIETIKILEDVLDEINKKGDFMRRALCEIVEDKNYFFSGIASMFQVFLIEKRIKNYTDAMQCDKNKYMKFFRRMLDEGIYLSPSQFETNFISAAHSKDDLEKTLEAYKKCL